MEEFREVALEQLRSKAGMLSNDIKEKQRLTCGTHLLFSKKNQTVKMEGVCEKKGQMLLLMAGSFPASGETEAYLEIKTEFLQPDNPGWQL